MWTLRYAWSHNRPWFWRYVLPYGLAVLMGLAACPGRLMTQWLSVRIRGAYWRTSYHLRNLWYFAEMARRGLCATYSGLLIRERMDVSWRQQWELFLEMVWLYRRRETCRLTHEEYWQLGVRHAPVS